MVLTLLIAALVLLILISGVLSASETALFSLSPMKVRSMGTGNDKRGQIVSKLLSEPRKLLVTILMLNVMMNILVQNVVSTIFGTFSTYLITVGVPLALTLIFGEILPKTIALSKNNAIALKVAPGIERIERIIKPVRNLIVIIAGAISRFSFFYLRRGEDVSLAELKHALRTSKEVGSLSGDEAKLIRGYLNLEEDVAKEIMCPRQEVIYYNIEEPLSKLMHLFVEEECSRIPICEGSLEKVLGIMTSQLFFAHRESIQEPADLIPLVKKPLFVPESITGKTLLRQLYMEEESIALVVDEYGSISGLVTLEDLVEIVIGQITDRRDEGLHYTQANESTLIASGKLELSVLEDIFDVHLESPNNMATIGGWLTERMGDIPKSGAKYVAEGFLFHILSADETHVKRVYIRYQQPVRRKG